MWGLKKLRHWTSSLENLIKESVCGKIKPLIKAKEKWTFMCVEDSKSQKHKSLIRNPKCSNHSLVTKVFRKHMHALQYLGLGKQSVFFGFILGSKKIKIFFIHPSKHQNKHHLTITFWKILKSSLILGFVAKSKSSKSLRLNPWKLYQNHLWLGMCRCILLHILSQSYQTILFS